MEEDAKNIILTVSILRGSLAAGKKVTVTVINGDYTAKCENLMKYFVSHDNQFSKLCMSLYLKLIIFVVI